MKTTVPGTVASLNNAFLETLQNMGVPLLDDAYGGNVSSPSLRVFTDPK